MFFFWLGQKKPLKRPYTGPYKVIERITDRVFLIDIGGTPRNVSVDNLKPAYFLPDPSNDSNVNPSLANATDCNITYGQRPTLKTFAVKPKNVTFSPETKTG